MYAIRSYYDNRLLILEMLWIKPRYNMWSTIATALDGTTATDTGTVVGIADSPPAPAMCDVDGDGDVDRGARAAGVGRDLRHARAAVAGELHGDLAVVRAA